MIVEEMNAGQKIAYDVDGTKLDFAEGALTMDLDRYRRDYPVTKDVMADGDGNLTLGSGGRYYVAQVEIPANTYTEVPAEKKEEPVEAQDEGEEQHGTPDGVAMQLDPLDMDKVVLRLWCVAGIEIF